eukprot:maker-scaffold428_size174301-snap-gene-0.20 protein:Tk03103 transcript:maker-scaffold428_size174301-snap-gene-0.20-mRNA-1 annotation:"conserved hypothetical protein"
MMMVLVITEKAEETTIHLLMQGANAGDSGMYECVPSNAPKSQIKVHILRGNQVAGLQNNATRPHFFFNASNGIFCYYQQILHIILIQLYLHVSLSGSRSALFFAFVPGRKVDLRDCLGVSHHQLNLFSLGGVADCESRSNVA